MSKGLQFIILWVFVLILIFVSSFHNKISKKDQKAIIFFASIVVAFMYAYRTLGLDLINYQNYYALSSVEYLRRMLQPEYIFSNNFEPLYVIYVFISKQLGLSFELSSFIYLTFSMLLIYRLIVKYTDEPLISFTLFILMFMFYFDLTRMVLAISVGLTAYMSRKKSIKVLLYIVAILSHYTVILLFIYEVFSKRKLLAKISLPVLIFGSSFSAIAFRLLIKSMSSMNFRVITKLNIYLNNSTNYVSVTQLILLVLTSIYPIVFGLFLYKKYINDCEFQNDLSIAVINTLKVGVAVSIVALFISNLRATARVMLPAISPIFLCFAQPISKYIRDGKIMNKGLTVYISIILYDLFMTAYYLWVAIVY